MTRFTDRTAVITGGATGIGLATAQLLAADGAHVVIAGRDQERGRRAVTGIAARGGSARFVGVDVAADDQVRRLADTVGAVDLWVNNAGIEGPIGGPDTWTDEAVREVLDVNVKGVLSGLRHGPARMRPGGLVVNIASFVGALVPVPIAVPYAASKAAVVAAGRAAGPALAESGISVITLCPWIIDTPMVDRLTGGAGAEARAQFAAGFAPSGRLTPPDHVAQVIADFWADPTASESGDAYLVDHGPAVAVLSAPRATRHHARTNLHETPAALVA